MDQPARHTACPDCKLLRIQRYGVANDILSFTSLLFEISSLIQSINEADPGYHMRYQAELGDVDFITGDYLAGTYTSRYLGSWHLG